MAIDLRKGQRVSLDNTMTLARVGLGWDVNPYDGGGDFDLDVSCFLVGENGKVNCDEDFTFYNNLKSRNEAVVHTGDNRTGEGEGDDESLLIDFRKVPEDVRKIVICVTIHETAGGQESSKQNFGQVSNAYVRVDRLENETDSGVMALRFDLMEEFSTETALVVCEIYRYNSEWKFNAVAAGYQGGLATLCQNYGLAIASEDLMP